MQRSESWAHLKKRQKGRVFPAVFFQPRERLLLIAQSEKYVGEQKRGYEFFLRQLLEFLQQLQRFTVPASQSISARQRRQVSWAATGRNDRVLKRCNGVLISSQLLIRPTQGLVGMRVRRITTRNSD